MLNEDIFITYKQYPKASFIAFNFDFISDLAWTYACEVSYQTTPFNEEGYQNQILSILESDGRIYVTVGHLDGYVEMVDVDAEKYKNGEYD